MRKATDPASAVGPENGGWRIACTCGAFGWWQEANPGPDDFRTIEQHSAICSHFIANAHHQIDGLTPILGGTYVPGLADLLRDLLDTPAAGRVMTWLAEREAARYGPWGEDA